MTAATIYNTTPIRVISFIFSFLQRIMASHFQRTLKFTRSFANNWLDISLETQKSLETQYGSSFSSSSLQNSSILASYKPKSVKISFDQEEDKKSALSTNISMWTVEEVKKLPEHPKQNSISEKSNNHLWLKIREIAHNNEQREPPNTEQQTQKIKTSIDSRRKDHMSSTTLKLEDYNRMNREYFYRKYHSGVEVDDYLFTHPSAKPIYSRNLLLPDAPLLKFSKARTVKRRLSSFKPTSLSTILENLAY